MAWEVSKKGNYIYAIDNSSTPSIVHEHPSCDVRIAKKYDDSTEFTFYYRGSSYICNADISDIIAENGTDFTDLSSFETWKNENTGCESTASVPTDLTGVETLLASILEDTENIDEAGIPELSAKLSDIILEIQNGNTNTSAILSSVVFILSELQDINANTDGLEALLIGVVSELQSIDQNTDGLEGLLTGSQRPIDVIQSTVDGVTDAGVQGVSILFRGNGGTLDGVSVNNNFSFSFEPNKGDDTVGSISYTVPTNGQQRVIITYVR